MIATIIAAIRASGYAQLALLALVTYGGVKTYLKVRDSQTHKAAIAQCVSETRAKALEAERDAMSQARAIAEEQLRQRGLEIRDAADKVSVLESELKRLRDEQATADAGSDVVFRADDQWLRKRRGAPAGPR